ncbi:polysaccharide deacetylase family protein [Pigmentiphaga litoralis]|uniref:Peptidoglycan/xylan/chitin deacetylase (PgdA/CDA1 family) n=1 Tax=Pigmentiphaga litoralis TaxID=516702 RepID=A0A7Y9IRV6_9BURK|nr:polysaccharide deacetylase family protein [Pigmentiphaga litoralis]NYE24570.1 peptidoglycan/xylan/chitin deacetylase (PgdA/CDA1 family) [Pigmentiphaga litoralis]NYE81816.1 peptidoglycan/xylan/chitin deacetylase (PgdA/CDA1 family) [Pigmentiphaga litoralis]
MLIPHHNRYAYSPIISRPDYTWPEGKRLAFHIGLNIEHFAFGTGLTHTPTVPIPAPDQRSFCWTDYGNRVGVFRLLDLFDSLGLPASHLVNTTLFEYAPEIVDSINRRGDEIIGHGRTNAERHGYMWEKDEARFIAEVRDEISEKAGQQVRGWMAPWMSVSQVTPDLLQEAGFKFVMDWPADDQPLWMKTRSGRIMSVPYPLELNDSPQMLVRHATPSDFEQMMIDQFEELLAQSDKQPLVFGLALHAMVVGQPYRLRALRRALQYISNHPQRDKVWFTRPGQIYDHCAALPDGVVTGHPAPR